MNNDLISRKWLTDAIRNRRTYLSYEDAKDIIDLIDNAPTVEYTFEEAFQKTVCEQRLYCPARPQGEWIYDELLNNWKCSECGETPKTIGYAGNTDFMKEHFKFCNHCGADMRGAE